jgi:polysaccharide export outer membrane protein
VLACWLAGLFILAAPAAAQAEPNFTAAYNPALQAPASAYRIGPLDRLNITVFQVKDLTLEKVQVDAGGQILLPLIGSVTAAGKTTEELSREIAQRLGEKYLQSPQVSVVVEDAVSQKITVQGAVTEAGVFMMRGRTSLLEAVAMAKGTTKHANLKRVAIVRAVDGEPHAAVFNLAAIQAGKERNPEVLANDVIVVDTKGSRVFWDNLIQALPALFVFSYF